ncbi:MAG: hypothetical protein QOE82_1950 [Thermoanaerobaculia bacterium]|jgi:hypothetical protein|nr:hypothetical protein [Thermoanaerobaculia bacterium]
MKIQKRSFNVSTIATLFVLVLLIQSGPVPSQAQTKKQKKTEPAERIDRNDCRVHLWRNMPMQHEGYELEWTSKNGEMVPAETIVPIWGNWCGPGYPKPGQNPKPVDVLDEACKAHDLCYEKSGYSACACDQQLVKTVDRLMAKHRDIMHCKVNGVWGDYPNPFYWHVAAYFRDAAKERGCEIK